MGRAFTCSYEEEACALELAAKWINEHCSQSTNILICTDSKSLCQKLLGNSIEATDLCQLLLSTPGTITIQYLDTAIFRATNWPMHLPNKQLSFLPHRARSLMV